MTTGREIVPIKYDEPVLKLNVSVNEEDIKTSFAGTYSVLSNPLTKGIVRSLDGMGKLPAVTLVKGSVSVAGFRLFFELPKEAKDWLVDFERKRNVSPIDFNLELFHVKHQQELIKSLLEEPRGDLLVTPGRNRDQLPIIPSYTGHVTASPTRSVVSTRRPSVITPTPAYWVPPKIGRPPKLEEVK